MKTHASLAKFNKFYIFSSVIICIVLTITALVAFAGRDFEELSKENNILAFAKMGIDSTLTFGNPSNRSGVTSSSSSSELRSNTPKFTAVIKEGEPVKVTLNGTTSLAKVIYIEPLLVEEGGQNNGPNPGQTSSTVSNTAAPQSSLSSSSPQAGFQPAASSTSPSSVSSTPSFSPPIGGGTFQPPGFILNSSAPFVPPVFVTQGGSSSSVDSSTQSSLQATSSLVASSSQTSSLSSSSSSVALSSVSSTVSNSSIISSPSPTGQPLTSTNSSSSQSAGLPPNVDRTAFVLGSCTVRVVVDNTSTVFRVLNYSNQSNLRYFEFSDNSDVRPVFSYGCFKFQTSTDQNNFWNNSVLTDSVVKAQDRLACNFSGLQANFSTQIFASIDRTKCIKSAADGFVFFATTDGFVHIGKNIDNLPAGVKLIERS